MIVHGLIRITAGVILASAATASFQLAPAEALLPFAPRAYEVTTADLDGDGDLDVLTGAESPAPLAWYENLGGSFGRQRVISTAFPGRTNAILPWDVDADGRIDIVHASAGGASPLTWIRNMGSGAFGSENSILATPANVRSVVPADLDGDGDDDLLVSIAANEVGWFETLAPGQFGGFQVITSQAVDVRSATAGDLDGDGDLDVLSASVVDDEVAWYENTGGSTWPEHILSGQADGATRARSVDIDGDGDLDVVATMFFGPPVAWFENLGSASFGPPQQIGALSTQASALDLADVDGDGNTDLLVTFVNPDGLSWFRNQGAGAFGPQQTITTELRRPQQVHAADLNGDGDPDALTASFTNGQITRFENIGGGFGPPDPLVVRLRVNATELVDLDADGHIDVLAAFQEQSPPFPETLAWLRNQDAGDFVGPASVASISGGAVALESADFDGDGDADIVAAFIQADRIAWFENLNGQLGAERTVTTLANSPAQVLAADLDEDGDQDLVARSVSDREVTWYANDGTGSFGPQQIITVAQSSLAGIRVADVDGDGRLDVLVATATSNTISWFRGTAPGLFGPGQVITTQIFSPQSMRMADLDKDGVEDLLVAASGFDLSGTFLQNEVTWLGGLGGGAFGPPQVLVRPTTTARDAQAVDLDLDDDLDVLIVTGGTGFLWMENLGGGAFSSPESVPLPASLLSIHTEDVDHDGDQDLVCGCEDNICLVRNLWGGAEAYCSPAAANSTGQPAAIEFTGSTNLSLDTATLRVTQLPAGVIGLFAASRNEAFDQNPGGSAGNLCLGASIGRFIAPGQVQDSGVSGTFTLALDLDHLPTPSSLVAAGPGETWYFQAWYRDTILGIPTSNFSDALRVVFY